MTATDPRTRQLSDMAQCAYRLGMAFGTATEQALGTDRWLDYFNAFDRCFLAVRVSTALELRLGRAQAEPREAASDREDLIERPDPPEADSRDHGYDERDRDRETERASLPILLSALDGVVAQASALPGPEPAELLTLRQLIAQVKADAPTKARPAVALGKPVSSLRSRLAGSAATALAELTRPAPHGHGPASHRATGPPGG